MKDKGNVYDYYEAYFGAFNVSVKDLYYILELYQYKSEEVKPDTMSPIKKVANHKFKLTK